MRSLQDVRESGGAGKRLPHGKIFEDERRSVKNEWKYEYKNEIQGA